MKSSLINNTSTQNLSLQDLPAKHIKSADPVKPVKDKVSVSEKAKKILDFKNKINNVYNEIEVLKNDRIKELKEKVERGFYLKDSISEKIADLILESGF